jgi:hypothetical protein
MAKGSAINRSIKLMDAAQFIGMKYRFDQAVKVAQLDFYV